MTDYNTSELTGNVHSTDLALVHIFIRREELGCEIRDEHKKRTVKTDF